jgi:signal peptidase I
MRLDFALLLVVLTALTGLVWLVDRLFFARGRAERGGKVPVVVDYSRSFFPVILAVLLFRSFLYEPFKIPSSSMMPTLLIGDYILVNKFAYGLRLPVTNTRILDLGSPKRGDVVVFRYPVDPSDDYIKRVIGVPGDVISYRNKTVYVNGQEVPLQPLGRFAGDRSSAVYNGYEELLERLPGAEHRILRRPNPHAQPQYQDEFRITVPEGHYFVMGDNRDHSLDSRSWGFVPEDNLVGRASVIWWNWDSRDGMLGAVDFGRLGTIVR